VTECIFLDRVRKHEFNLQNEQSCIIQSNHQIQARGDIFFVEGKLFHVIPVAVPIPIKDDPAFCMMARTSAKSTLTNPGT
jgi:hypothetical protein